MYLSKMLIVRSGDREFFLGTFKGVFFGDKLLNVEFYPTVEGTLVSKLLAEKGWLLDEVVVRKQEVRYEEFESLFKEIADNVNDIMQTSSYLDKWLKLGFSV